MEPDIVKIKFCVELDITNIEFYACFAIVAGANVAFLNKKCHVKLDIRIIKFCVYIYIYVYIYIFKWNSLLLVLISLQIKK